MEIIRAGMQEAGRAAALAQLLWPGHAQAELEQELAGYLQGPGRCDGAAARLRGVGRGKRLCRICKRLWAGQRRKRRVSSARRLCRGGAHHLLHKAAVRNVESEPLRDA